MRSETGERAESTFLNCSEAVSPALTTDTELGAQTSTHVVALFLPQMALTCKPCKSCLQDPLRRLCTPVEILPGLIFCSLIGLFLPVRQLKAFPTISSGKNIAVSGPERRAVGMEADEAEVGEIQHMHRAEVGWHIKTAQLFLPRNYHLAKLL